MAVATAVALLVTLAGCSSRTATPSSSDSKGLKTGPGVTKTEIHLGTFADLSGPYAIPGKSDVQGITLAADEVNAAGGVCGRDIVVDVNDTGFNVQTAVAEYTKTAPTILGINLLVGSSISSALDAQIQSDKMLTAISYATPAQLQDPYILMPHTTNEYSAINGVDYLVSTGALKKGDTLGHIYFQGDSGATALLGTQYAAKQNGLTLAPQQIAVTDTDLSAAITALVVQHVSAIFLNAGPTQLASAASLLAARGLDIPIVTTFEAWTPALLKSPAADAITKNTVIVSPNPTYESSLPAAKKLRTAFDKKYPGQTVAPTLMWAYAYNKVYFSILQKACDNHDLTRDGVAAAYRQLAHVDADGLSVPLDFSKHGISPSFASFIDRIDPKAADGLKTVLNSTVSKDAKSYSKSH